VQGTVPAMQPEFSGHEPADRPAAPPNRGPAGRRWNDRQD
jgi:hypothetical protein